MMHPFIMVNQSSFGFYHARVWHSCEYFLYSAIDNLALYVLVAKRPWSLSTLIECDSCDVLCESLNELSDHLKFLLKMSDILKRRYQVFKSLDFKKLARPY